MYQPPILSTFYYFLVTPTLNLNTQLSIIMELVLKAILQIIWSIHYSFYFVLYLADNPPCRGIANSKPNKSQLAWHHARQSTDVGIIDGQSQQLLGLRRIDLAQHANI